MLHSMKFLLHFRKCYNGQIQCFNDSQENYWLLFCCLMNNNQFVETYYKDIKNACSKYYNMINNYIEYEDFLQQTYCIFLKRKSFDENYNVKPFTFICTVVKNEALQIIRNNKAQKRYISKDKLASIDYINDDDGYNESNLVSTEIDESYNVKPFTFICTVVKNEALQIIRNNKSQKRYISKDKLASIDYINDDDGFNESNIVSSEIDESEFIRNDMIEKIKEKLSPLQNEIFYYLINDYKPREVSKILGMNGNSIRKNYGYIRDKARKTLEYYNLDIK